MTDCDLALTVSLQFQFVGKLRTTTAIRTAIAKALNYFYTHWVTRRDDRIGNNYAMILDLLYVGGDDGVAFLQKHIRLTRCDVATFQDYF